LAWSRRPDRRLGLETKALDIGRALGNGPLE
jgi:hypothetical protein